MARLWVDATMKDFYVRRFALWRAVEKSLALHSAALKIHTDE